MPEQGVDAEYLTTMAKVLDGIGVALCQFDEMDRTVLWNSTFLLFFPEHAGHVHAGETYRQNLVRFYRCRLTAAELPHIERYIQDGIARHRAQARPFVFQHRGRSLRVASLPTPDGGRVRVWTALPDEDQPAAVGDRVLGRVSVTELFANLADGAVVLDPAGRVVAANREFLALYDSASIDAVEGRTFTDVVQALWMRSADGAAAVTERIATFIDNARFAGAPFEVELPGGRWRRVIERRMSDGTAYLSHADITILKQQQRALSEAGRQARDGEERFRLLTENSGDIIISLGHDGRMHFVSPAIKRVLGWDPGDVSGGSIEALVCPEDFAAFRDGVLGEAAPGPSGAMGDGHSVLTSRFRHRQGGWIWMEVHARSVAEATSQTIRSICNLRDITERVAAEASLQEAYRQVATLAVTDALTGTANRRRLEEVMLKHGAGGRPEGGALSLLLIDVDHFKRVNDRFGHQIGDQCLQMIARIIAEIAHRDDDLVARFGGEEFAVVLPGTGAAGALAVANAIRQAIEANREHWFNRDAAVTVSVGVATSVFGQGPALSKDALILAADQALYRAKREGRNRVAVAGNG